jgi:uncharacterized SAM-binding protein YcdF (DUF218 family)
MPLSKNKLIRRLIKAFMIIGIILLIVFSIPGIMISSKFDQDKLDGDSPRYMVILGARVRQDGLSKTLRRRLDAAIPFLQKDSTIKVIVSGGQGPDEPVSEARAMAQYLIEKGIDSSRILQEDKSMNTRENLSLSKKLIPGADSRIIPVWIVTSNYHQYRAQKLARQLNYNPYGIPCSTPAKDLPLYFFREMIAVIFLAAE